MSRHRSLTAACLALAILGCLICGCRHAGPHRVTSGEPALQLEGAEGRVSPGYEQWLARQSMLFQAKELTAQLSGSNRLWQHSAAKQNLELLLRTAPTWLEVNPWRCGLKTPFLKNLLPSISSLKAEGFQGLWVSPLNEKDSIWVNDRSPQSWGRGTASLNPDHAAGNEKDVQRIVDSLESSGIQPGSDLVAAAPGLGPDFMLQARGSLQYQGLFVQAAIPRELWNQLPPAANSWDCKILSPENHSLLAQHGVLPAQLVQDETAASTAGWAITGEVLGVDGVVRRLAYRYAGNPWRPVLFWQDPSGNARTLLAGSIIQTTGQRRQTLAGISLQALAGLDVAADAKQTARSVLPKAGLPGALNQPEGEALLFPAPQALADLTGQVHRWGGWSLLTDTVFQPDNSFTDEMLSKADFINCPPTNTLTIRALETGNASPLAAFLQNLLSRGVDMRRLAHGLHSPEEGSPNSVTHTARILKIASTIPDMKARTSAAASALHALLAVPCGLPGLCFLPSEDLSGQTEPGRPDSAIFAQASVSAADTATPSAMLSGILAARHQLNIANGHLTAVRLPSQDFLILENALPGGGLLLTAINFSSGSQSRTIAIPARYSLQSLHLLTPLAPGAVHASGQSLVFSLKARQAVHLLVGAETGSKGL